MNTPLTTRHLFDYGTTYFRSQGIVSRQASGATRTTFGEIGDRVRRLASGLRALGVRQGDRVGTVMWNDQAHLESYFAIPCMGAVLHTINFRMTSEHLSHVINHAGDRVLIVDRSLWPQIAAIRETLKTVTAILLTGPAPGSDPDRTLDYETLIAESSPEFAFPDLDEDSPMGLCYTSATTGPPKGVLYSHRALYLHSMTLGLANTLGLSADDTLLPIVPMFHVNAWGLPFAAFWLGAKIVLPGPSPHPEDLLDLLQREKVTLAAGVPTVWLGLARELMKRPTPLNLRLAVSGGSAVPQSLIRLYEETLGIPFLHAYGMTETSPLVTVARLRPHHRELSYDEQLTIKASQGIPVPGLTFRLERDGQEVSWTGNDAGEICLKGPWIADGYYRDQGSSTPVRDGWFHTGDVATVTAEGYVHLLDRTTDLIKSGGEWISSVDLENALMAHPAVFEAAVVGVPHPVWDERPLAFVVLKDGCEVSKEELFASLAPRYARWQWPDDILFVPEVPKSSVGKFLKRALREQYRTYFTNPRE